MLQCKWLPSMKIQWIHEFPEDYNLTSTSSLKKTLSELRTVADEVFSTNAAVRTFTKFMNSIFVRQVSLLVHREARRIQQELRAWKELYILLADFDTKLMQFHFDKHKTANARLSYWTLHKLLRFPKVLSCLLWLRCSKFHSHRLLSQLITDTRKQFVVTERLIEGYGNNCVYVVINPLTCYFYCGEALRHFSRREAEHFASVHCPWKCQQPWYEVCRRLPAGQWLMLPILSFAHTSKFELLCIEDTCTKLFAQGPLQCLNYPYIKKKITRPTSPCSQSAFGGGLDGGLGMRQGGRASWSESCFLRTANRFSSCTLHLSATALTSAASKSMEDSFHFFATGFNGLCNNERMWHRGQDIGASFANTL